MGVGVGRIVQSRVLSALRFFLAVHFRTRVLRPALSVTNSVRDSRSLPRLTAFSFNLKLDAKSRCRQKHDSKFSR
jgi:hypothetical protein